MDLKIYTYEEAHAAADSEPACAANAVDRTRGYLNGLSLDEQLARIEVVKTTTLTEYLYGEMGGTDEHRDVVPAAEAGEIVGAAVDEGVIVALMARAEAGLALLRMGAAAQTDHERTDDGPGVEVRQDMISWRIR